MVFCNTKCNTKNTLFLTYRHYSIQNMLYYHYAPMCKFLKDRKRIPSFRSYFFISHTKSP